MREGIIGVKKIPRTARKTVLKTFADNQYCFPTRTLLTSQNDNRVNYGDSPRDPALEHLRLFVIGGVYPPKLMLYLDGFFLRKCSL